MPFRAVAKERGVFVMLQAVLRDIPQRDMSVRGLSEIPVHHRAPIETGAGKGW